MNPIVAGIIRHVITAIGAVGVGAGYTTDGDIQVVVSSVIALIGVGMSMWEKYKRKQEKP